MTVTLALVTSVLWGFADFGAGLLARRLPAARVVVLSQTAACVVLGAVVLATGAVSEAGPRLWFAVAAGLVGPLALLCFYEALARGPMGVVSPLATAGVVIPVSVGLAVDGDRPGPLQYVGIAVAIAGIALAGGGKLGGGGAVQRQTLLLTAGAAVGFGSVFALIAEASASLTGLLLAQFVQRCVNVVVGGTVMVATERRRPKAGDATGEGGEGGAADAGGLRGRIPRPRSTRILAKVRPGGGGTPVLEPRVPGPARTAAPAAVRAAATAGVTVAAAPKAGSLAPRSGARAIPWALLPALTIVGVTDVAANGTYATAAQHGPVTVAAVLGSLYPVITALAAVVFLKERLLPPQAVGAGLALAGTVLLAAG
ncbi:EamA family transporter [Streptodolium elevatio]|uniref:EamA family transporter n=1 Tax=Streptodolium elevatio TaxID=3157996 RepID=A0ABV3DUK2_9ACTN